MEQGLRRVDGQVSPAEADRLAALAGAQRGRLETVLSNSRSANTRRAHDADWRHFAAWCGERDLTALPAHPMTVCLYILSRTPEGHDASEPVDAASTLRRRVSTISAIHQRRKQYNPCADASVKETLAGAVRMIGERTRGKDALSIELLRAIIRMINATADANPVAADRDIAILLVAWATAMRRSELVALDWADLEMRAGEGYLVHIRTSKGDQTGRGQTVGVPYGRYDVTCPVAAVDRWAGRLDGRSGPLFRRVWTSGKVGDRRLSDQSVAEMLKKRAAAAGFDPNPLAAHSLRAGHVTTASNNDVSAEKIRRTTRHADNKTLAQYSRDRDAMHNTSAGRVDL